MFKAILALFLIHNLISAEWKNGDIILQQTPGQQAKAVQIATNSEWTHVGVVFITNGKPVVFEAVQPVQVITLKEYINRSLNGKYKVMRLKDTNSITEQSVKKAITWAKSQVGKNYDGRFQWSDKTLYCSELVWKLFKTSNDIELCTPKRVRDYNIKHPTVKKLIRQRFGSIKQLNLDELIVAPSDIAESELLITVDPEV